MEVTQANWLLDQQPNAWLGTGVHEGALSPSCTLAWVNWLAIMIDHRDSLLM